MNNSSSQSSSSSPSVDSLEPLSEEHMIVRNYSSAALASGTFTTISYQYPAQPVYSSSSTSLHSHSSVSLPYDISTSSLSLSASSPPYPPVLSALLAAQQVQGTATGSTLLPPSSVCETEFLFLSGDSSGAGKSSVAMGILHCALKHGYLPHQLAYIKPCTQCEDIQLVSKYCEAQGIAHRGLGPVIFYEGFTAQVIDGTAESVETRHEKIVAAVNSISQGKRLVLVDGVGYAAVGSCAGVSNAQVASLLRCPVMFVARAGIGNAIDATNFMLAYFLFFKCKVIGACWNKIPPVSTYHSFDRCHHYVTQYYEQCRTLTPYGHIPLIDTSTNNKQSSSSSSPSSSDVDSGVSCRLRPARNSLQMSDEEEAFVQQFNQVFEQHFNFQALLTDVRKYYAVNSNKLVSVV